MYEQKNLFRDRFLPDVSVQQSLQDWLPIEIHQVSNGRFRGQLREISHAEGSVFFEHQSCSVHKRGIIEDDFCTVSFARAMDRSPDLRFSEYDSVDSSLFFLPRACEFDVRVAGNVQAVYFRFSQSSFLARARALNPALWEKPPDMALAFDAPERQLHALAADLYSSPLFQANGDMAHVDSRLGGCIMDAVLLALNAASSSKPDPDVMTRRRARQVMGMAIEYIRGELNRRNCPSVVDVCQHIKVSQRTLQYSFLHMMELTPNAYLRYLRLNRVHTELAHADRAETTVTEVATSWHFYHLGRFSNDYLYLFGELPSTTLKRALA